MEERPGGYQPTRAILDMLASTRAAVLLLALIAAASLVATVLPDDKKITAQFDAIIESTGATVKKISRKAPEMNSFAESWVASIKRECLDDFMVLGERHLEYLAHSYVSYYNSKRPHRGIGNVPIGVGVPPPPEKTETQEGVACDMWLGGLLRHYRRAA